MGIISGLDRMGGNAVQTDARLSPANYGGPLVDLRGRVIGLIVPMSHAPGDLAGAELYDSGIGFAVPGWLVRRSVERLSAGRSIRRGLLGVQVDHGGVGGVRIRAVADPSPARRMGIEPGDVITEIDDKPVANYAEMQRRMAFKADGDAVALTIQRGDQVMHVDGALDALDAIGPLPTTPAP